MQRGCHSPFKPEQQKSPFCLVRWFQPPGVPKSVSLSLRSSLISLHLSTRHFTSLCLGNMGDICQIIFCRRTYWLGNLAGDEISVQITSCHVSWNILLGIFKPLHPFLSTFKKFSLSLFPTADVTDLFFPRSLVFWSALGDMCWTVCKAHTLCTFFYPHTCYNSRGNCPLLSARDHIVQCSLSKRTFLSKPPKVKDALCSTIRQSVTVAISWYSSNVAACLTYQIVHWEGAWLTIQRNGPGCWALWQRRALLLQTTVPTVIGLSPQLETAEDSGASSAGARTGGVRQPHLERGRGAWSRVR